MIFLPTVQKWLWRNTGYSDNILTNLEMSTMYSSSRLLTLNPQLLRPVDPNPARWNDPPEA